MGEGGHWLRRFPAETKIMDGTLLLVDGQRKVDTMEWLGMRMTSPTRVVYDFLNWGSGADQSALQERGLRRTSKQKPPSVECFR